MGNLCSSSDNAEKTPAKAAKYADKEVANKSDAGKKASTADANNPAKPTVVNMKPAVSWQVPMPMPDGYSDRILPQSRDPHDYTAEGLIGETWVRSVGQVTDQRINLDQCSNSTFYITDQLEVDTKKLKDEKKTLLRRAENLYHKDSLSFLDA